jgi:2-oxoglutarate ferredoxin oxidoreductase subunit delta
MLKKEFVLYNKTVYHILNRKNGKAGRNFVPARLCNQRLVGTSFLLANESYRKDEVLRNDLSNQRRYLMRGKPIIDVDKCKGCELCNGVCPVHIMSMSKTFNKQGVQYSVCIDEEKCTVCRACAIICPDMVIKVIKYEQG